MKASTWIGLAAVFGGVLGAYLTGFTFAGFAAGAVAGLLIGIGFAAFPRDNPDSDSDLRSDRDG